MIELEVTNRVQKSMAETLVLAEEMAESAEPAMLAAGVESEGVLWLRRLTTSASPRGASARAAMLTALWPSRGVADAQSELELLLRSGDKDGNRMLTADEVYELLSGEPLDEPTAELVKGFVVLKDPAVAQGRWERWASLFTGRVLLRAVPVGQEIGRAARALRTVMEEQAAALSASLDAYARDELWVVPLDETNSSRT